MNRKLLIPATAALFSMTSVVIASEADIGQRYISPMVGYVIADDDRLADDGAALQLGLGQVISNSWNIELSVMGDNLNLDNAAGEYQQIGLGFDGLYFFTRGERFSPYALIGIGGLRTKTNSNVNAGVMANVGAGLMSRLTDGGTALRLEVRNRWDEDQESVATENAFSDWIVNVGMAIPFGGAAATTITAAPPADTDGDGVADAADSCPGTPSGAKVDRHGCEAIADGDGIVDSKDRCPATPAGTAVDASGCERDSDGDGVPDNKDACPDTNPGNVVDDRGCVVIAERVNLKGVTFGSGSANLTGSSRVVLDEMAGILTKHTQLHVEVAGFTDNTGAAAYNVTLSRQRAEAVRQYLIGKGVPQDRLTAKGYGPAEPVADNTTASGRNENRRVELRITGK